jgi:hypothetical protein
LQLALKVQPQKCLLKGPQWCQIIGHTHHSSTIDWEYIYHEHFMH